MSGGSFNYLCYANCEKILTMRQELKAMEERLLELGFEDVVSEVFAIQKQIDSFEFKINKKLKDISDIFRAVEWMDSGDSNFESVKKAVEIWRNI